MADCFEKKVSIVTGGASGIGRVLCQHLARRGAATVTVADIDQEAAEEVASSIRVSGGSARAAGVDVARYQDVQDLVETTVQENGRLDYCFNNAGVALMGEARDLELVHWQRLIDVNLWGAIYGTIAAYRAMVKQGFGHIVNTASLGGLTPEPMAAPYVTAKHGVVGLSTALRLEGAGLGVKVSVFCPGMVKTGVIHSADFVGVDREAALEEMNSWPMNDVEKAVRSLLRGVQKNQAVITDSAISRFVWRLHRIHPGILNRFLKKGLHDLRMLRYQSGS